MPVVVAAHPAAVLARKGVPTIALAAPTPTVNASQGRALAVIGGAIKAPGLQF